MKSANRIAAVIFRTDMMKVYLRASVSVSADPLPLCELAKRLERL